jgi:hypothetical protein
MPPAERAFEAMPTANGDVNWPKALRILRARRDYLLCSSSRPIDIPSERHVASKLRHQLKQRHELSPEGSEVEIRRTNRSRDVMLAQAAVVVQAWVQGFIVRYWARTRNRARLEQVLREMEQSACRIQAWITGRSSRRRLETERAGRRTGVDALKHDSASVIQGGIRGGTARPATRSQLRAAIVEELCQAMCDAVIRVQACFSSVAARQMTQQRRVDAAVQCLQAGVEGHVARCRVDNVHMLAVVESICAQSTDPAVLKVAEAERKRRALSLGQDQWRQLQAGFRNACMMGRSHQEQLGRQRAIAQKRRYIGN